MDCTPFYVHVLCSTIFRSQLEHIDISETIVFYDHIDPFFPKKKTLQTNAKYNY